MDCKFCEGTGLIFTPWSDQQFKLFSIHLPGQFEKCDACDGTGFSESIDNESCNQGK